MKQQLNIDKILAKKSLGQNFITDKNFLSKISSYIHSNENTNIIEIGPGKGALTKFLVKKKYKSLILIEKDKVLANKLAQQFIHNKRIKIENQDALYVKYKDIDLFGENIIVGNLPFNISTQLLFRWLDSYEWPPFYSRMILMFQKEVADRIVAKQNTKNYGRLSVSAQSRCKINKLMTAPAEIFTPQPKVQGVILDFKPLLKYKNIDFSKLQKILRIAFSQRRKKIKTNLKEYLDKLKELGINTDLRPENLSVSDYCDLTSIS